METKETIMVVDDEPKVRSLLTRILEGGGYTVMTAASGKEALHELSSGKIKVVLLDIRMPEMSGLQMLQKIENISEYCIIIISSEIEFQTIDAALKLGIFYYILKPFSRDETLEKVGRFIDKWRYTHKANRITIENWDDHANLAMKNIEPD